MFEPLEVALNRVWGIRTDRSYWRNQWVSLGLVLGCGALAAAIVIGVAVEAAKCLYILIWPFLDFRRAYGPFFISVTLVVWGFLSSMIVLAAAGGSRWRRRKKQI